MPVLYTCREAPFANLQWPSVANFKYVLVTALVTGYGSKPGAGWTLKYDVGNNLAFTSQDGLVTVLFQYYTYGFSVIMMDEAPGNSPATLFDGINIRTGGNTITPGSSTRSHYWCSPAFFNNSYANQAASRWAIVADGNTFAMVTFSGNYGATYYNGQSNLTSAQSFQYGSEFYCGRFISSAGLTGRAAIAAIGGLGSSTTPSNSQAFGTTTTLRNVQTGLHSYAGTISPQPFVEDGTRNSNMKVHNSAYHADRGFPGGGCLIPARLQLAERASAYATTSYVYKMGYTVGWARGVATVPGHMSYEFDVHMSALLGGEFVVPTALNDDSFKSFEYKGHEVAFCWNNSHHPVVLTTHPDFW